MLLVIGISSLSSLLYSKSLLLKSLNGRLVRRSVSRLPISSGGNSFKNSQFPTYHWKNYNSYLAINPTLPGLRSPCRYNLSRWLLVGLNVNIKRMRNCPFYPFVSRGAIEQTFWPNPTPFPNSSSSLLRPGLFYRTPAAIPHVPPLLQQQTAPSIISSPCSSVLPAASIAKQAPASPLHSQIIQPHQPFPLPFLPSAIHARS